jgi:RNA polymerase sigma-70 factor (ECF subfamily)
VEGPALAETFVQSYGQLRGVAAKLVNQEDVDDMVQEAFLRALTSSGRFRGEAAETTWLYRILVNTCLDARRYRRRRGVQVTLDEAPAPFRSRRGQTPAHRYTVRRALKTLSSSEREVCVMYDVMGYTHLEISRRLGIPVGTSKGRLCNARRRLRRLLGT